MPSLLAQSTNTDVYIDELDTDLRSYRWYLTELGYLRNPVLGALHRVIACRKYQLDYIPNHIPVRFINDPYQDYSRDNLYIDWKHRPHQHNTETTEY